MNTRPEYVLGEADLIAHLHAIVRGLQISGAAHDNGIESEAARLAVEIRKLVRDARGGRNPSVSVLSQLGIKQAIEWVDTAYIPPPGPDPGIEFGALVALSSDGGPWDFKPTGLTEGRRLLSFDEWWTPPVGSFYGNDAPFSRNDLVLITANQAGGAHVDPTVSADYYEFARRGGFTTNRAQASVRQIATEVLATLERALPAVVASGPLDARAVSSQLAGVQPS